MAMALRIGRRGDDGGSSRLGGAARASTPGSIAGTPGGAPRGTSAGGGTTALPAGSIPAARQAPVAAVRPVKTRRAPITYLAAFAMIGTGAVVAASTLNGSKDTTEVLVLSRTVEKGEQLTAEDFTSAKLNPDPALSTVPATDRDAIVGRNASETLLAGTLLTDGATTWQLVPSYGSDLVGISLAPQQLPIGSVHPGDAVRLVITTQNQTTDTSTGTAATAPDVVAAEVVDIADSNAIAGTTNVTVQVLSQDSPTVAAAASAGTVSLIVASAATSATNDGASAPAADAGSAPTADTSGAPAPDTSDAAGN